MPKTLEYELTELNRKILVLENNMKHLESNLRKLENYMQEWFNEDNRAAGQ